MNATRCTLGSGRKVPALLLVLLLSPGGAWGKQPQSSCGTYAERAKEEIWRSRASRTQRETEGLLRKLSGLAVAEVPKGLARDQGDIALIEEDSGIVARRNLFNLAQRLVRFTPAPAGGYRVEVNESDYSDAEQRAGTPIEVLGDDDTRELKLPFAFPYFGNRYSVANVNSDGNVTFDAGDGSSRDRGLGRLLSGLPRIAPFFTDLDPSRAGAVYILSRADRWVATWLAVPQYSDFGIGAQNTFQLRLFPDGKIEIAYNSPQSLEAVVGISPGRLEGNSTVGGIASFSGQTFPAAIAERFSAVEEIDTVTAAQRFFETHEDAYDYVAIYNALGISAGSGVVAYEVTTRNQRSGYGDTQVDYGTEYGSPRRLQAVLNLGSLDQYPIDPTAILPQRFSSRDTPITVVAHEAGHLFLAFASVRDPQNPTSLPMLGRQSAHWAYTFNSEASLLEGNRIQDKGPGVSPRFETVAVTEQYSPYDQYLMGFRAKEEVGGLFYVSGSGIGSLFSPAPSIGRTFDGERRDVSVDDVIREVGRRTPDSTVSQRKYRFAFVVIVPRGLNVGPELIQQVDTYRQRFEAFYTQAAGQRATAETSLKKAVAASVWPATGLVAGQSATGRIRLATPLKASETFAVRARSGLLETPGTVTIPAGQQEVVFPLRGSRSGVDTVDIIPTNAAYETVEARVQVQPAIGSVQLRVLSGDLQVVPNSGTLTAPIVVKATDENGLPYAGLRVSASPLGTGKVDTPEATTGFDGTVSFRWTPAAAPFNLLRLALAGGSSVTVTALGRPYLLGTSVVNAASFRNRLTPLGLHTIFGANLAGGIVAAPTVPWPLRINDVEVLVNGEPQPIAFLSDGQINFYLAGAVGSEAQVQVRTPYGTSDVAKVGLTANDPGIFFDPVSGRGAVIVRGNILEVYGTGMGQVQLRNNLFETVSPVSATVNGLPAEVLFNGLAPGFVGLYQVNVRVPATAVAPWKIRLTQAGNSSNEVSVSPQ